jgi:hypothetical protein
MKDKNQPLRGKVARVLNSRELVLNIGAQHGVEIGMKFDVIDPKGEEIKDPDTGALLGSLTRPKVRVEVSQVTDNLSVARTFKARKINIGGENRLYEFDAVAKSLLPPRWITEYETLRTPEKTWEDIDERESLVKVGDPAVEVLKSESDDRKGFPARVQPLGEKEDKDPQ